MDLKPTLFRKTGPAIGKSILGVLFGDPISKAAATTIYDFLLAKWEDEAAASRGRIEFDKLAVEVAERLVPVFEQDDIPSDEQAAIANAIAERLEGYPFSSKRLAKLNNSPEALSTELLADLDERTRDLSETASQLYRRAVKLSAQYIVNIADMLPAHATANYAEMLDRLSRLEQDIRQTLDHVQHIHQTTPDEFERDYRQAVARKYDFMDIFGADLDKAAQKHQLTVAYISLNAVEAEDQETNDEEGEEPPALRVEEAIAPHQNTLIIGPAGGGKTTLAKWLAVSVAQRSATGQLEKWTEYVPFFIPLRTVKGDADFPMPEQWVKLSAPVLAGGERQNWTHKTLTDGRGLVIVDGIDEVPRSRREAVREWISNLKSTFGRSHFILTSRPAAIRGSFDRSELEDWQTWLTGEEFRVLELQDLEAEDLQLFVSHWHEAVRKASSAERQQEIDFGAFEQNLLKALRDTPPLRRLAVNPLLCAMVCAMHFSRNMALPQDRLDLYEECVKMLLERDPWKGLQLDEYPKFSFRQKKNLMSHLAYSMMRQGLSSIDQGNMEKLLGNRLELLPDEAGDADPAKSCEYFVARTGLLREIAHGDIDFAHRTFQEYLTAYAAIGAGELEELLSRTGDDQWHEVLIAAAGLAQDQSALLIQRMLEDKAPSATILALACLETASNVPPPLQGQVTERMSALIPPMNKDTRKAIAASGNLAVSALAYRTSWRANEAAACANALGLTSTELAMRALVPYLLDRRVTVSRTAFRYLRNSEPSSLAGEIIASRGTCQGPCDKEAIEFVCSAILYSQSSEEECLAFIERTPHVGVYLLDYVPLRDGDRTRLLFAALKDRNPDAREGAVEALSKVGTHSDLSQLTNVLEDSAWRVRKVAVEAFGKLGTRHDLPQVTNMLKDSSQEVRRAAVEAFGKLATHEDLSQVANMLRDDGWLVRQAAVGAFGKLGTQDDLPQILSMLRDDGWMVRQAAVCVCGSLGSREHLPQVVNMLTDQHPYVRRAGLEAFNKLVTCHDLANIPRMLEEDYWEARRAAVEALGKVGTHDDLPKIANMLRDRHPSVRRAAGEAVNRLATHSDLCHAVSMLRDDDEHVRQIAMDAFSRLITHEDLPQVVDMLREDDEHVRQAAMDAFSRLITHEDLPQVVDMLREDDEHVRQTAMGAFITLTAREDLPEVADMLKDDLEQVRQAALNVLSRLVAHEDLPQVADMLRDHDEQVRQLALDAFDRLVTQNDLPWVVSMLEEADPSVRGAAVRALGKLGTHGDLLQVANMLKDGDMSVQMAAAFALRKLGTKADLPQVASMLRDARPIVRDIALRGLSELRAAHGPPQVANTPKQAPQSLRGAETASSALGSHGRSLDVSDMLNRDIDVRHVAKAAVRTQVRDEPHRLREFAEDGAPYPLDVKLYFRMAIGDPEYLDELNRRLVAEGEEPRW